VSDYTPQAITAGQALACRDKATVSSQAIHRCCL
jgi:hypothetical protein